jgi:LmbE family N-acetylglucosaminyl deacetylase
MTSQAILILSPHPDDETLGCGGTVRLLTRDGTPVDVVFLTRGELGTAAPGALSPEDSRRLAEVRVREAHAACAILGVRQVYFLGGTDGALGEQPHLAGELRQLLAAGRYARVFCPWPQEKHPDHAATYGLLLRALGGYETLLHVWLYEVWTPLQPTLCVPIDGTIDDKVAAIRVYESQLQCLDYLAAFRGLAAYRSLFCPESRFAEAFIATDSEALLAAARTH